MQNWQILSIFVALGCFSLACSIILWYLLNQEKNTLRGALTILNQKIAVLEGEAEAEAEAYSQRMSEQGRKGVMIREDNKAMRADAMREGRALISGLNPAVLSTPEGQARAKAELAGLAMKYPKVAEEVADRLIGEFHAEPYADLIKGVIARAIQGQGEAPAAPQGPPLFG